MKNRFKILTMSIFILCSLSISVYTYAHGPKSRKLGGVETFLAVLHETMNGDGTTTAIIDLKGKIDKHILTRSAKYLFHRHPLLQSIITKKGGNYYFNRTAQFSAIPVEIIEKDSPATYQQNVTHEHNNTIDPTNHTWRITAVNYKNETSRIIFTMHHAISDGRSLTSCMQELLTCYQQIENEQEPDATELPFLPSMEELLKNNETEENAPKNHNIHVYEDTEITRWKFHNSTPFEKRSSHNICIELSTDQLNKLKVKSRAEKTTINGALNAAMLISAARTKKSSITTTLHTPISQQPACAYAMQKECVMACVSMPTTIHCNVTTDSSFWDLARDYNAQLSGLKTVQTHAKEANNIESKGEKYNNENNHFSQGFTISNVGRLNFASEYGSLKVNELYIFGKENQGAFIMKIMASSINNKLFLSFSYTAPLISTEWAQSFVNSFVEILNKNTH